MAACTPLIGGVMGAKEAFDRTFRQLIMTMPYSKITVTELCRKAHLSRKTFYSTFQDKEAVLESIFVEDVVVPIREMNRLLSVEQRRQLTNVLMENIYTRIWDDKEFYQALVRPMKGVDDTFIRVVTHSLEALNNEIIAELSSTKGYEAEYVSYFFAASQAMLVQKWIFDGFPLEPKELAALYKKMLNEYWLNQF